MRVGTNFGFSVGNKNLTVPAGPANQGGYCKIAYGFDRGSNVRVTENARSGVHVSRITVRPVARKVSANKAHRTAAVIAAESSADAALSVSPDQLDAALDELLDTRTAMTRVLLGGQRR